MNYKWTTVLVVGISFFAIGYGLSYFVQEDELHIPNTDIPHDAQYGGEYLTVVYIGASSCPASNNPENHANVRSIIEGVDSLAAQHNLSAISRGISLNNVAKQGIAYLEESGPYDEVIAGLRMYSTGLEQYVWDTESLGAVTPQIIVYRTWYDFDTASDGRIFNISKRNSVLARTAGSHGIARLYRDLDSEIGI